MPRVTVAFFVNAAGGKESPVLIGKNKKPRCFSKLKDASHPSGAHYLSNDKAWMRTEIMTDILTKLNTRMKREGRIILMFLDNAPCHPPPSFLQRAQLRVPSPLMQASSRPGRCTTVDSFFGTLRAKLMSSNVQVTLSNQSIC